MHELVLDSRTLPEPLFRFIRTEKVKARECDGEIRLTPIIDSEAGCPLLGIAADCGFTVDDFLARKREEKVLEGE
jgi:hypothetical protein